MSEALEASLVRGLARDIVELLRPEELPLVAALSDAALTDPDRLRRARTRRDEPLGIGVDEVVALLSPAVLVAVTAAVEHVAEDAGRTAARRGLRGARRLMGGLFRRGRTRRGDQRALPAPETTPLTAEQLAEIRRLALARAAQLGLAEDKATLLADALVGGLLSAEGKRRDGGDAA